MADVIGVYPKLMGGPLDGEPYEGIPDGLQRWRVPVPMPVPGGYVDHVYLREVIGIFGMPPRIVVWRHQTLTGSEVRRRLWAAMVQAAAIAPLRFWRLEGEDTTFVVAAPTAERARELIIEEEDDDIAFVESLTAHELKVGSGGAYLAGWER